MPMVYKFAIAKFDCSARTVQRDLAALADVWAKRIGDPDELANKLEAVVARMERRASNPFDLKAAQRADETLLKLLGQNASKVRLRELGIHEERRLARLAELEVETKEATLRLTDARTKLAEAEAKAAPGGTLIVGDTPDLAKDMTDAELEAMTPSTQET